MCINAQAFNLAYMISDELKNKSGYSIKGQNGGTMHIEFDTHQQMDERNKNRPQPQGGGRVSQDFIHNVSMCSPNEEKAGAIRVCL